MTSRAPDYLLESMDLHEALDILESRGAGEALEMLERVRQDRPWSAPASAALAEAYSALGRWDDALRAWSHAAVLAPFSGRVQRGICTAIDGFVSAGRADSASHWMREGIYSEGEISRSDQRVVADAGISHPEPDVWTLQRQEGAFLASSRTADRGTDPGGASWDAGVVSEETCETLSAEQEGRAAEMADGQAAPAEAAPGRAGRDLPEMNAGPPELAPLAESTGEAGVPEPSTDLLAESRVVGSEVPTEQSGMEMGASIPEDSRPGSTQEVPGFPTGGSAVAPPESGHALSTPASDVAAGDSETEASAPDVEGTWPPPAAKPLLGRHVVRLESGANSSRRRSAESGDRERRSEMDTADQDASTGPPPGFAQREPTSSPVGHEEGAVTPSDQSASAGGPDKEPPEADTGHAAEGREPLDDLIETLQSARIVPAPDPDSYASPDLRDDIEDMVSETLARIYESQRQFREAARVYAGLARLHPEDAVRYRELAEDMLLRERG